MTPRTASRSLVFLLILLLAGAACAQEGRWMIGLDALSSSIGKNDNASTVVVDESAPGVGFQAGYLFTPTFMVRLYAGSADHHTNDPNVDIRFGGGTVDAVYLFSPGAKVRPYVFGGVGGFKLESQQASALSYSAEGGGAALGAGLHVMLGRKVSLHGSLRFEAVNWNKVTATYTASNGSQAIVSTPVDENGNAAKFTVGLSVWL